jgi:hypothetical protein
MLDAGLLPQALRAGARFRLGWAGAIGVPVDGADIGISTR